MFYSTIVSWYSKNVTWPQRSLLQILTGPHKTTTVLASRVHFKYPYALLICFALGHLLSKDGKDDCSHIWIPTMGALARKQIRICDGFYLNFKTRTFLLLCDVDNDFVLEKLSEFSEAKDFKRKDSTSSKTTPTDGIQSCAHVIL